MTAAPEAFMSRDLRVACFAILLACGCRSAHPNAPSPDASQGGTTFVRGMLVRADGSVVDDAVVAIEGSRIARVGTAREMPVPPGAAVLRGSGEGLTPRLVGYERPFLHARGVAYQPDRVDFPSRATDAGET